MKNRYMRLSIILSSLLALCLILGCHPESTQVVVKKISRSQRTGLMVLNFKNNTLVNRASEFQPWEFGIASMVMTDLESVGLFNIISRERLKDILDLEITDEEGETFDIWPQSTWGFNGEVTLNYQPIKHLILQLGYRYQIWQLEARRPQSWEKIVSDDITHGVTGLIVYLF